MKIFAFSRVVSRKLSLRGVFPPVPTPFFESSELIDFDASEVNFEKLKTKNLSGFVALGSNGQYPFLSETESLEYVKSSVKLAHSQGRCLIAGAGCESTIETVRRCEKYVNSGVDGVLVITPHYYSPLLCESDYVDHFYRVADKCKVPVILYNMPRFAHVNLSIDCVKNLAVHDNIIGIKDSTGNVERYAEMVEATKGEKFCLISGTGGQFCSALKAGAVGCIAALANVLGDELSYILKKFEEGRLLEAEKMQDELKSPNEVVTSRFGLRGLNQAMKLFGYKPGVLRSPLKSVNAEDAKIIDDVFQKFINKKI